MTARRTIDDLLRERLEARTQREPHQQGAPLGYVLRGASTLLDADGNVVQQWVKTTRDGSDPSLFLECFQEIAEERIRPALLLTEPVGATYDPNLIGVIPYGDPHMGMLSWHVETGADFDLKIARQLMTDAGRKAVGLMPACVECLVISVGDFFHADNNDARTRSGHPLDTDSRIQKVMRVGLYTFVDIIDCALLRHQRVRVIMVSGNHDPLASQYLAMMIELYYRHEPRVTVDQSLSAYRYYQFGKCMFQVSHGHGAKFADLGSVMAADVPEMWGATKFRHAYSGHLHHTQVKELRGCTAETLNTLAAGDDWHAGKGYRASRKLIADIWHREFGHRCRHTIGISELRDGA